MAETDSGEVVKQVLANTTSTQVDFAKRVRGVYIKSDADVYFAFDRTATTSDFLIEAADGIVLFEAPCTEVHLKAVTTANVYLIGIR